MADNYYATTGGIESHICPFCKSWALEAPALWPQAEVRSEIALHVGLCKAARGIGRIAEVTFK